MRRLQETLRRHDGEIPNRASEEDGKGEEASGGISKMKGKPNKATRKTPGKAQTPQQMLADARKRGIHVRGLDKANLTPEKRALAEEHLGVITSMFTTSTASGRPVIKARRKAGVIYEATEDGRYREVSSKELKGRTKNGKK